MELRYDAYNAYLSVKEKEGKDSLIPKVRKFEYYLKELASDKKFSSYEDRFYLEWLFKRPEKISNIDNYLCANIVKASESFERIITLIEKEDFTDYNRRLIIDFIADLKPIITRLDPSQDYSWLLSNTNTHMLQFYYSTLENIFLSGVPGKHEEERLVLGTSSPFLIRQCIEFKIAQILGIKTIKLSDIPTKNSVDIYFKVFQKVKNFYDTNYDVEILNFIYKWSNTYIHQGYRPRPWETETAIHYLKDLFQNSQISNSSFIKVEKKNLQVLREQIDNKVKKLNINYKIDWYDYPKITIV